MAETKVPLRVSLLVISFVPLFLAIGLLQVVISAWLPTVGFTAVQVGLLITIQGIFAIATAIPLGIVSDVYGRKLLLVSSAFAGTCGLVVFGLTTNFLLLVFASGILGYAEGASVTTWNALLADMTDASNRNKVFSLSFVMITIASGVGLALPGAFPYLEALLSASSYEVHRGALLVLGSTSVVTPAMAFLLLRGHKETHNPAHKWGGLKNASTLAKLGFVGSTIGFGAGFIIPLIGTWFLYRFNVGDSYSGPVLAVSSILVGLAAFASPRLAVRFGQMMAIMLAMGSSMAFMLAMAFLPNVWVAAAFYIVRSGLMNMASPLLDSFSMSIFPAEQRGLVSGLTNIMFRLPNSVSTYFGGYILGVGLLQLPFFIASALYVVGIVGFFVFFIAGKGEVASTSISTSMS
ncbi:MAG: MFS transporter [Nitrososphaerales archaeon]|nr:MFS transporter [Nitrososphaerales archaeon]